MAQRILYRSTSDKKVAGLMGGLAVYLDIDVNFLRLVCLFLIFVSGFVPGLVAYIIAAAFVPIEPIKEKKDAKK